MMPEHPKYKHNNIQQPIYKQKDMTTHGQDQECLNLIVFIQKLPVMTV